jgi:serine phosphatase RsbU (regulator of sigma subunit)
MRLLNQLNTLESAGLVRIAQLEPDLEYLFRHALVREAAYASILSVDQKVLHLEVGEAIERLYPDKINEYAAVLSYHFGEAGEVKKAQKYCVLAGKNALASYANREAEGHFRCALSLVDPETDRAELQYLLGEALYRQSRYDEAIQTWLDGIKVFQQQGDLPGVARSYARSARAAWYGGDQPQGLSLSLEGLEAVKGMDENAEMAMLIHEAARAYHFNGYPGESEPFCRQALKIAEKVGAVGIQADALTTLGVLPNVAPEEALRCLARAVEIAESSNLLEIATRANHNLGVMTAEFRGDLKASLEYYLRAADFAQQRGAAQEEIFSLTNAGSVSMGLGEINKAEDILERINQIRGTLTDPDQVKFELAGIEFGLKFLSGELQEALEINRWVRAEARQRGDLQMLFNFCMNHADVYLVLDHVGEVEDWSEAELAAEEGIELSDRGVSKPIRALCMLSAIYIRQGRLSEARELYHRADQMRDSEAMFWQEQALLGVKRDLARVDKNWGAALAAAEEVSRFLARSELRWPWGFSLVEWAETHLARGEAMDYERARALYREALVVFVDMGSNFFVDVLEERLRELQTKIAGVSLAHDQVTRELAQAGRIQSSFLPEEIPEIEGWEISAALLPARDTSGDFYDFIQLPGDRLGIVIADVADKGVAAALFMTTCRTLIRTYAAEHVEEPELTIMKVNQRILSETHGGLFITLFYAVLDPASGLMKYCNAGHNPPYVLSTNQDAQPQVLARSGMPLGILDDITWERGRVQLMSGDVFCSYTDGITETQDEQGEFYKEDRLLDFITINMEGSAESIREAVLEDVEKFRGVSPRFDDMTFAVVKRL